MMTTEQEKLIQEPIFQYFHELCQIPRPSFHEEKISAYLLEWAGNQGLEAEQDAAKNVFIRKPATPGYEHAPCIMLQAHMDMVCEKSPEIEHDFDSDSISWQIEGDRINTGGRTTLGADDGIGVAYAMAILTDENIRSWKFCLPQQRKKTYPVQNILMHPGCGLQGSLIWIMPAIQKFYVEAVEGRLQNLRFL